VKVVRRVAIAGVGGVVLFVGVLMIVLPGPAILVIPAGLAILGQEFTWARRLLDRLKTRAGALEPRLRAFVPLRTRITQEIV
jgi:hypothetical protein